MTQTDQPPSKHRRLWQLFVLVILVALAGYYGQQHRTSATPPSANTTHQQAGANNNRPIPVYTAQVSRGDLPIWVTALGSVTPRQQVVLRSRIDGELIQLHFQEGQFVHKGQLLAEIDSRALETQYAQQKGQLAKDRALLANAQRDLARYNDLAKDDAIATQQRDTQAALVQQYQATIDSDLALLSNTTLQLSYTKIKAPLSGKIGFRQVDVGNQIKTSDSNGLATIMEIDPITVIFALPENYLPTLLPSPQQAPSLIIEAWDKDKRKQLASSQSWIMDNQVDASTGSIRLKAFFNNPMQQLTPNQFVNIHVQLGTLKDVLIIPSNALLHGAHGDYVYRIDDDNIVTPIPVQQKQRFEQQVAVSAPLKAGDRLVTDGSDKLRAGSYIKPITLPIDAQPVTSPSIRTAD